MRKFQHAFTIVELLVSVAVLTLLILFVSRLFSSAAVIATSGTKRLDDEAQVRPLLGRMSVDFSQMLKRSDVDYYLKSSTNPQTGNDQIAFYSNVTGYYPSTGSQSPISVVAYRINSNSSSTSLNKFERMAKGLVWNGVSATDTPVVFLPLTISSTWPAATNGNSDPDYELIAPYIFRFEYYYLLKNGSFSDTPWNTSAGHTNAAGMRDITAISVCVATIDPKSRRLLSDSQMATLNSHLIDFSTSMVPGELLSQWQTALDTINDMPRPAISAIRIYERYFYLLPK
jgi:prepilin-type N-terminal cleavage/methylation domain-containing protein